MYSVFSGVQNAQMQQGGSYFEPGRYRVKVKAVKMTQASGHGNEPTVIVETEVLRSTNPSTPPGSGKDYAIPMVRFQNAKGMVKQFIAAGYGISTPAEADRQVTEAVCEAVVGPQNPMAGQELDLEVHPPASGLTKQGQPKKFCKHLWYPSGTLNLP